MPLVQAVGGWSPPVCIKGSGGLSTIWHLLCNLQVAGINHSSHLRNQRGAWPTTTRGLLTGSTCSPSHLRGQQKKRALQATNTCCFSRSPGNPPTLLLPLPKALGSTPTHLITVTSQDPATRRACSAPPEWVKQD